MKNAIDGLSEWAESVSIGSGDEIGTVCGESSISDILGGEMCTERGGCSSKRGWRGEGGFREVVEITLQRRILSVDA